RRESPDSTPQRMSDEKLIVFRALATDRCCAGAGCFSLLGQCLLPLFCDTVLVFGKRPGRSLRLTHHLLRLPQVESELLPDRPNGRNAITRGGEYLAKQVVGRCHWILRSFCLLVCVLLVPGHRTPEELTDVDQRVRPSDAPLHVLFLVPGRPGQQELARQTC